MCEGVCVVCESERSGWCGGEGAECGEDGVHTADGRSVEMVKKRMMNTMCHTNTIGKKGLLLLELTE